MSNLDQLVIDSPPGQVTDVYNDIFSITGSVPTITHVITHNIENQVAISLPDQKHRMLICKDSVLENGNIQDPKTGLVYTVDHLQLTATVAEETGAASFNPTERESIEKSVNEYVGKHYHDAVATVFSKEDGYHVYISGTKYNPKSFWAGRWKSQWHISKTSISGTINVRVHYYEDGNVQLQTSRNIPVESIPSISDISKTISVKEKDFQSHLGEFYVQDSVNIFKNLRRPLPITKSKIEWPAILSYKVGEELSRQ